MLRCGLTLLSAAAALALPALARAQAPAALTPSEVDDRAEEPEAPRGWRVASGLRVEQWIAPVDDHLRFDVRLALPEMAFGEHLSFATFDWERLDVAEGRSGRDESGTVYNLLGARYRRERDTYGFFVGAHLLTWSGHGRPVTPWLGVRLGRLDGPSITAEARLLGLGPQGGELLSPLDDADISVAIEGPRLGPCQIGARGRARDVRHPDRHQREQMASLGVEFGWGRRRLFVGLGIQHQMRRAARIDDAGDMPVDRMAAEPAPGRIDSTAFMLHLDAETPLPRSIVPE